MGQKEVYYNDYLELDKILNAQHPESDRLNKEAHDEMLFIVIHQAYELWFKQIIHEVGSVIALLGKPKIEDNSPDLYTISHRLKRVTTILRVLVQQIDIMETMTSLDFLDFRDLLRPASGFQSHQFKLLEAYLGLKFHDRHGQDYYLSHLRPEYIEQIKKVEEQRSVIELTDEWLDRMPFFDNPKNWENYKSKTDSTKPINVFWADYRKLYEESLSEKEKGNMEHIDRLLFSEGRIEGRHLSAEANRNALFIMLYRDHPLMHLPYEYLKSLLDIDEMLATWRFRHINMVHRIIGRRIGTGGSSGKDYLKGSLDKHYVFKEIADITTFIIERQNLPKLSQELIKRLSFTI